MLGFEIDGGGAGIWEEWCDFCGRLEDDGSFAVLRGLVRGNDDWMRLTRSFPSARLR